MFAFKNKKLLKLGKKTVNRQVCFGPMLIANQMVSLIIVLNDIKVHNIRYPSISWAHKQIIGF
jgi:predicted nucleotide-binding protein (sugar kinase/HSP70/actin superfamily)